MCIRDRSVTVLFAVSMAVQMKISPVLMGIMAILGAVGGTASPIALTGIIVGDLMAEMGIQGLESQIFLGVAVSNLICAAAMYFLLGGYKLRGTAEKSEKKTEKKMCIRDSLRILRWLLLELFTNVDMGKIR